MKASVGDVYVVESNRVDTPARHGRIIEVRGSDGAPPYLVEWEDTGHQGVVFPGSDAHVEHQGSDAR
jgi:hypothetical protein